MKKSRLRVISGKFKGRKISFNSKDLSLRPSLDRVRETVFNWLSPYIFKARGLDLFAGSGIFSFEALSRGAELICAVEQNFVTCQSIIHNAQLLDLTPQQLQVIHQDVKWFLQHQVSKFYDNITFNLAFLDPPYLNRALLLESLQILSQKSFMSDGSKIYVECPRNPCILAEKLFPSRLKVLRSSQAGKIGFYLLSKG